MSTVDRSTRLIFVETQEYPLYLSDLSQRNQGTLFPSKMESDAVAEFGFAVVELVPAPEAPIVTEGKPTLEKGVWKQTWISKDYSVEEKAIQFDGLKQSMAANIEAFRISQFEKGFPYSFAEGEYHVQIRTTDRQNISSIRVIAKEAIAAGKELPIKFRVYENKTVQLTAEQFVELADTTFLRVSEGYQAAWDLKDLVDLSDDVSDFPDLPESLFVPVESFAKGQ